MSSACSSLPTDVTTTMRSLRRMGGRHSIPLPIRCQAGISPGVDRVLQPNGSVRILLRGNEPERNGPAGGLDEWDSLSDQDRLHVNDDPVHLACIEEGREQGRSADEPDVLPLLQAEPPRELLYGLLPAHELHGGALGEIAPAPGWLPRKD